MAKKTQKINKRSSFKQKITRLSLAKKIAIPICVIAAVLFVWQQVRIYQERTMYNKAEQQIQDFMSQVVKLAPGEKTSKKYCSYTSEKFSKGSLGCSISSTIRFDLNADKTKEIMIEESKRIEANITWPIEEEVVNEKAMYRGVYYSFSTLSCALRYISDDTRSGGIHEENRLINANNLTIEFGCSGPALKEYY